MPSKKVKIALGIIVSIIIIAATLFILINRENRTVRILFYNTTERVQNSLLDEITTEFNETIIVSDFLTDIEDIAEVIKKNSYDIIITDEYNIIDKSISELKTINIKPKVIPSSPLSLGIVDEKRYGFPLQLDHIEIAIKNDLYSVLNEDGLITLDELEEKYLELKSHSFYPLIIAGGDNYSYRQFISLLFIALYPFNNIDDLDISNYETSFPKIKELISRWEESGILHSQWRVFSLDDARSFIDDGIAGSTIMPLSVHRTYTKDIIGKYTATRFPALEGERRSTPLLAVPTMVLKGRKANLLTNSVIKSLFTEDAQKKLSYSTGIVPVHSKITPMDVQVADARFWAAASSTITPIFYK